jgi:hypothetical protein
VEIAGAAASFLLLVSRVCSFSSRSTLCMVIDDLSISERSLNVMVEPARRPP